MKKFKLLVMVGLILMMAFPAYATVSSETTRVKYTCNGTITIYAYPFKIYEDDDLLAVKAATATGAETPLILNTDYTVSGAGVVGGGNLTLTAGSVCPSGYTLTILRNIELTQDTDYVDGQAFSAESLESAIDKVTLIQQQQAEQIGRAPKLPKTSSITDIALPNPAASHYIGWNAGATQLENKTSPVALTTATQYEIDALVTYGGGTSFTKATIDSALTAIGTTNKVTLLLRPGTWAISSDADYSAYSNVTWVLPPGATFSVTVGKTLVLGGAGPVYTSWWGNSATALASAIASNPGGIIVVDGDMTISTGVVISTDHTTVEKIGSPTITYTGSGAAVQIAADYVTWPDVEILYNGTDKWYTGADTSSIGLELLEASYCRIKPRIEGFWKGLKLFADTGGCVHNEIYIDRIYDNATGIYLFGTAASGWVNSNTFFGGHITVRSANMDTAQTNTVAVHDVYIASTTEGSYANNGNQFFGVALEGGFNTGTPDNYFKLAYINGNQNDFYGCRWECAYNADAAWTPIHFGPDSLYNKIIGGRDLGGNDTTGRSNEGSGNWFGGSTYFRFGRSQMIQAGTGLFEGGTYAGWDVDNAAVMANNLGSQTYPNFLGRVGAKPTFVVTGAGAMGLGVPIADTVGITANASPTEQIKAVNTAQTYFPKAQWQRSTAHKVVTSAGQNTAFSVAVPDGHVVQIIANVIARKSDNSEIAHVQLRSISSAAAGTATIRAQSKTDPAELNYGTMDTTNITFTNAGGTTVLKVGSNAAGTYYFSAMIEWQLLGSDS